MISVITVLAGQNCDWFHLTRYHSNTGALLGPSMTQVKSFLELHKYPMYNRISSPEWAIPENIHTPLMDDIGNPARNAQ